MIAGGERIEIAPVGGKVLPWLAIPCLAGFSSRLGLISMLNCRSQEVERPPCRERRDHCSNRILPGIAQCRPCSSCSFVPGERVPARPYPCWMCSPYAISWRRAESHKPSQSLHMPGRLPLHPRGISIAPVRLYSGHHLAAPARLPEDRDFRRSHLLLSSGAQVETSMCSALSSLTKPCAR